MVHPYPFEVNGSSWEIRKKDKGWLVQILVIVKVIVIVMLRSNHYR